MISLTLTVSPPQVAHRCSNAIDLSDFLNAIAIYRGEEWVEEIQHLLRPQAKEFLINEVLQIKSFILKDKSE